MVLESPQHPVGRLMARILRSNLIATEVGAFTLLAVKVVKPSSFWLLEQTIPLGRQKERHGLHKTQAVGDIEPTARYLLVIRQYALYAIIMGLDFLETPSRLVVLQRQQSAYIQHARCEYQTSRQHHQ